jgi:chromosome segregation ATPase
VSRPPESLDLTLTTRLREIVTGAAATEGELRLLAEQGQGLARALTASIGASEARLGELAAEPEAAVAEMAAELRRVESLREELDDLRADLAALDKRARALRGKWLGGG